MEGLADEFRPGKPSMNPNRFAAAFYHRSDTRVFFGLKFLHLQRRILFHGHEPLDTDTTPDLEGEAWLLRNGYTQSDGVANLDLVPEKGALVAIGYPKFGGGTGAYARYIAICPSDWR